MISKIYIIRGIGRFKDFECKQGIELEKLTLIYSENGQGKSTLADICRSMAENSPARLLGRKTVGSTSQLVKFATEDGVRCFHNDKWTPGGSDILVFDEVFVNDNVYQGLTVEIDQRRNLLPIVIGNVSKQGIEKEKVLKDFIASKTSDLKDIVDRIQPEILQSDIESVNNLKLEEFLALDTEDFAGTSLEKQRCLVDRLVHSDRIHKGEALTSIELPSIPIDGLEQLFNKTYEDVANEAERELQVHIEGFSGTNMRDWIKEGSQYKNKEIDICPYCGQMMSTSQLIGHYKAIFSEKYDELYREVAEYGAVHLDFSQTLSDLSSTLRANRLNVNYWEGLIEDVELPEIDYNTVEQSLEETRTAIDANLSVKRNALLESVDISPDVMNKYENWIDAQTDLTEYNAIVEKYNCTIQLRKREAATGDLALEGRKLLKLRNKASRESSEIADACDMYIRESVALKDLKSQLAAQQAENSATIKETINTYRDSVNKYLGRLHRRLSS